MGWAWLLLPQPNKSKQMNFNFWETSIGKDLDQKSQDITKWMYAMLVTTGLTAVLLLFQTFRKK
jgi:hypothetical protein